MPLPATRPGPAPGPTPEGPVVHTPPPVRDRLQAPASPFFPDGLGASVRNQAIDRLEVLSHNHARRAFEPAGTPICPHAIAFLYLEQPNEQGWRRVVAATRVVSDTQDVRNLHTLLFRLARLARERYVPTPGGFDPAIQMANYRDPATGRAEYIGLGVSALDTPGMTWEQAHTAAADTDDLGGRMFLLVGDTTILVDRPPARRGRRDLGIHATGDLNYPNALTQRLWTFHQRESTMPADPEVWDLLADLHQLTYRQNRRPTL